MTQKITKKELLERVKKLLTKVDKVALAGFVSVMEMHNSKFEKVCKEMEGGVLPEWENLKKKTRKQIADSAHDKEVGDADKNLQEELKNI